MEPPKRSPCQSWLKAIKDANHCATFCILAWVDILLLSQVSAEMMLNVFNCVILVLVVISLCVFCYFIVAPEQFDSSSASQHGDRVKHQEPAGGTCRTESSAVDRAEENESTFSVQVVVLGDIGRSPRMQYHARSLADRGAYVNIVGYLGRRISMYHVVLNY